MLSSGVNEIEDEAMFDLAVSAHPLLIVKFTATWCGPCRRIAPEFERIANQYSDNATVRFLSVDVDKNQALARRFNVNAMPTFLAVAGGKPMDSNSLMVRGADAAALERMVAAAVEKQSQMMAALSALFLAAASSSTNVVETGTGNATAAAAESAQQSSDTPTTTTATTTGKTSGSSSSKDNAASSSSSEAAPSFWMDSFADAQAVASDSWLLAVVVAEDGDDDDDDDNGDCGRLFRQTLNKKKVKQALQSANNLVCVKVKRTDWDQEKYPVVDVPTMYFLNGGTDPVLMKRGVLTVDQFLAALELAEKKRNPAALQAAREQMSADERKQLMQEKIERIRKEKEKAAEQEEIAKEKQRIEFAKKAAETKKKVQELKERNEAIARKREKEAEKEAARKIREQVRLDKLERQRQKQERLNNRRDQQSTTTTTSSTVAAAAAAAAAASKSNAAAAVDVAAIDRNGNTSLLVKTLNDAVRVKRQFPNETLLSEVKAEWLVKQENAAPSSSAFVLCQSYPRHTFTADEEAKSLLDLGLSPSASLIMIPASQESGEQPAPQLHQQPVQQQDGGGSWTSGFFSVFVNFFSFLASFFTAPQQQITSRSTSSSSSPSSSTNNGAAAGGRFQSMAELRAQRQADDDNTESYNGNSTTQF